MTAPSESPGPPGRESAELAGFYDRRYAAYYMEETSPFEAAKLRDVLASFPLRPARILDFGCGQGRLTGLLGEFFEQSSITGTDISETALEMAAQKLPGIEFVPFEGQKTPFADSSFDLVFSYHVLEHVPDLPESIAEMARLTRPGGRLVACLPCGDPGSLAARIVDRVKGGRETSATSETRFFFEDEAHLRRVTSRELTGLFQERGLELEAGLFANHHWGEVNHLVKGGIALIKRTFPLDRAKGPRAFFWLLSLALPLSLLALPARLYATPVRERIGNAGGLAKKLMWALLLPLKLAAWPMGAGLEGLARREWRKRRNEPGGSAQYLIFRRRD
jgi:ubiquinone/menaquinone biosynthesis C-methylase UbiE